MRSMNPVIAAVCPISVRLRGHMVMRAPHVLTSSKGMGMVAVAMGQIPNQNLSPKPRRKKVKTNCAELWTDQNMLLFLWILFPLLY